MQIDSAPGLDGVAPGRLAPPRVPPGVLPRPELIGRVLLGLDAGAVSVTAGAGYGKTTLLAQAVSRTEKPVVWLSCDERLRSTSSFLRHLGFGFSRVVPGFGAAFPRGASDELLLSRLAHEMAETLADDVLLVVDDIHSVPPDVLEAFRRFVRDAPPQVLVAVAGRQESPLTRADLTNRRHLRVTEEDLRLGEEEAAELLARAGMRIDHEQVCELTAWTEGWVSGLLVGGQAGRRASRALVGARSEIFDLLADEVFGAQPDEVQRFLLGTSVLERFTADLAAEVTDVADAGAIAEEVVRRHLFCTPLDGEDEDQWFRYHQLLRDYLRLRLGVRSSERRELHRRAARALAERGLVVEAISHHLDGQEPTRALDLLEAHAEVLVRSSDASELRGWLARVPVDEWWSRPAIVAAHAARVLIEELDYDLATQETERSIERLLELEEHDRAAVLLAQVGQTRIMGGLGRKEGLERTAELLPRLRTDSVFVPLARICVAGGYGWHGDFDRAEAELVAAAAHPASVGSNLCEAWATTIRAHLIDRVRGDVVDAPRRLASAIALLEQRPEEDVLACAFWASIYRAFALSYVGRHDETTDELARARRIAHEEGHEEIFNWANGWLRATASADQEQWQRLADDLQWVVDNREPPGSSSMVYYISAFAAQLASADGEPTEAVRRIALAEWQMEETLGGPDFTGLCDLAHAARLAGSTDEAERLAETAHRAAADTGSTWGVARACVHLAALQGPGADGDSALEEALGLSHEHRFEDLWVYKERRIASGPLARALEKGIGPPDHVRRLVGLCGGEVLETVERRRAGQGARSGAVVALDDERRPISIAVLGGFTVRRGEDVLPESAFGRERARALLAILCAHLDGVSRDEILEWLWPDLPPHRGARALSTTLHSLRRAVEPHLTERAKGSRISARAGRCQLVLDEDDALDFVECLDASERALATKGSRRRVALEQAEAALSGEPFAPWRFEAWAEEPRARVERTREAVLSALATCLVDLGEPSAAAKRFESLLGNDPLREEWHRGVMSSRAAAGEMALALRQYHACRTRLLEEQGVEPSEETRALYACILKGERPAPSVRGNS